MSSIASAGTVDILKGNWWASDPQEDARPCSHLGETISEGQGGKDLRQRVAKAVKTYGVEVMSLSNLREHYHVNPVLTELLQMKFYGQVFSLPENATLQNGKKIPFQCFNEEYIYPFYGSLLKEFADQSKNPKAVEFAKIAIKVFENAISHDRCNNSSVQEAITALKTNTQAYPLLLGAGYDWHSTQALIYLPPNSNQPLFGYGNRGEDSHQLGAGWSLCAIEDKAYITADLISTISRRLVVDKENYISLKSLKCNLDLQILKLHIMSLQKGGTCTLKSLKAILSLLSFLYQVTNGFTESVTQEKIKELIDSGNDEWIKIYKEITTFERQALMKSLLIDLEEASHSDTPKESITKVAELMYHRLITSPLIGEKVGWSLWLQVITACEKHHTPSQAISAECTSLINKLEIGEISHKEFLIEFGKMQNPAVAEKLCENLFHSELFDEVHEISLSFDEKQTNNWLKKIIKNCLKSERLEEAKKYAKKLSDIALKEKHFNLIAEKYAFKGMYEQAQDVTSMIEEKSIYKYAYMLKICERFVHRMPLPELLYLVSTISDDCRAKISMFDTIANELIIDGREGEIHELMKWLDNNPNKNEIVELIFQSLLSEEKDDFAFDFFSKNYCQPSKA